MTAQGKTRIDCVLVAGGRFHDIDFARLELLKLLAEDERVRVRARLGRETPQPCAPVRTCTAATISRRCSA